MKRSENIFSHAKSQRKMYSDYRTYISLDNNNSNKRYKEYSKSNNENDNPEKAQE